jgi:nucleoside-diphosphate-sugar epimerase
METIFITGATGFIGNAILRQCVCEHRKVFAMSRNGDQDTHLQSIGAIPVRCDLDSIVASHLASVSTIIHAAGAVGPTYTPKQFEHINNSLTIRLFHQAKEAGVKQFIYISSDTVVMTTNNQIDVNENADFSALTHPYVSSKVQAEKFLLSQIETSSMQIVCLRPRLVWGQGDRLQLPLISQAINAGKFWWIDHGKSLTSVTYIGNLTHAVSLIIGKLKIPSGAYFIADAEQHTHKVFWKTLLATRDIQVSEKSLPKWLLMPIARLLESLNSILTPSKQSALSTFAVAVFGTSFTMKCNKAFKAFGYQPVYSFEQGLATMKKGE